jgi:hypothetical protein
MSKKKGNRKRRGHYCWSCGRIRANEKFSGAGHKRHLCRDCAKLGAAELNYRSEVNNLDRCMTWEGIIPRKRRRSFGRFLTHEDPRIRDLAVQMQKEDECNRRLQRDYNATYGPASRVNDESDSSEETVFDDSIPF